ncbi:hypothetical protein BRADI_1g59216v3 [Brachypodium distachyon]|uniref:Uncharacterized protein n=1 Tax=Brachypodium distachyon TaxID=15368 RepID=A0A0Q3LDY1_BRADI|nr:hypothetical protein BRADI_1g59216v3 [Brachypodium distachyon]
MRRIPRLAPPSFPSASIPSGRRLHPLPHDLHRPPSLHRPLPAPQTSLQRPLILIRAAAPFVPPPSSRGHAGAAASLPPFAFLAMTRRRRLPLPPCLLLIRSAASLPLPRRPSRPESKPNRSGCSPHPHPHPPACIAAADDACWYPATPPLQPLPPAAA